MLAMSITTKPTSQKGKGTTFRPIEKGLNNGILGCTGGQWVDPNQPYCASRTIPCGTWVYIENLSSGGHAWCKVLDRGPYGKIDKNGNWFNAAKDRKQAKEEGKPLRVGQYRSIIDMSPLVSLSLGSKGMSTVRVSWWKKNPYAELLDNLLVK